MAGLLWALGLSHARVGLVLGLFGVVLARMSVWRDIQALGQDAAAGRCAVTGRRGAA